MNEQLQLALTTLLTHILSEVDTIKDFSAAQLPDVIRQFLLWNFVSSLLAFGAGVLMVILFCYKFTIFRKHSKTYASLNSMPEYYNSEKWTLCRLKDTKGIEDLERKRRENYKERQELSCQLDTEVIIVIIFGVLAILGFLAAISHFDWLKIWIAPKVYIIEYLAHLIK